MRRLVCVFLFSVVLPAIPVQAGPDRACCSLPKQIRTLKQLGRAYRRLRRSADAACCRRFNSGLMQAMSALRDSLQPGTPAARITKLMGRPDVRSTDRYQSVEAPQGDTLLVYHWRSTHDFLYFVIRRGQMVRGEWYNAWE